MILFCVEVHRGSTDISVCFAHQLFKGKFFVCQGEDVRNITNKSDCMQANYKWVRHKYNFDNLGQVRQRFMINKYTDKCVVELPLSLNVFVLFVAHLITSFSLSLSQALMSLFVLASKDGWVDIMYDGLDAVGVDQQV